MKKFAIHLTRRSSAPPEALYDLLADLSSHTTWGGTEQWYNFRLRSLDAPPSPATVGTTFTSTGSVPMSMRRFEDRSEVTVAQRPFRFEFLTNASVPRRRRRMTATYRHRYEISATPTGSRVTYSMTQLSAANPFLRLKLPLLRDMAWGLMIPLMSGRGFRNFVAAAERVRIQAPAGGSRCDDPGAVSVAPALAAITSAMESRSRGDNR